MKAAEHGRPVDLGGGRSLRRARDGGVALQREMAAFPVVVFDVLAKAGEELTLAEAYTEALRLDPHRDDIAEALARLRQGADLLAAGSVDDAATNEDGVDGPAFPADAPAPQMPVLPTAGWEYDPMRGWQRPVEGGTRP